MSKLKEFLNRRSANLSENEVNKEPVDEKKVEKDLDLSDDEFWAIMDDFTKLKAQSDKPVEKILEEVLEAYSSKKIMQFAEKYEKLNR